MRIQPPAYNPYIANNRSKSTPGKALAQALSVSAQFRHSDTVTISEAGSQRSMNRREFSDWMKDKLTQYEDYLKNPEKYDKEVKTGTYADAIWKIVNEFRDSHFNGLDVESIAMKIARGEVLSAGELEFLKKKNPDLLKAAETAKQFGDQVKLQMKTTKSREQRQTIMSNACLAGIQMSKGFAGRCGDGDRIIGILFFEAVRTASEEAEKEAPVRKYERRDNNYR